MVDTRKKHTLFRAFMKDRVGNFGTMTAILLPVLLAGAGIAMDLAKLVQVRSALQDAADSAALSAASALAGKGITDEEAIALAKKFMAAQFKNTNQSGALPTEQEEQAAQDLADTALASVHRTAGASGATNTYQVTVNGQYDVSMNAFTKLLGYETVRIGVSSTSESTTESKNALSMYLVLDRSGSMGENTSTVNSAQPTKVEYYSCGRKTCSRTVTNYVLKIDALKIAVADLVDQLDTADPEKKYVRTAAISYNSSSQTPTTFEWGTTTVTNYVNALTATGGTDSSNAFKTAYQKVTAASEASAHLAKNGQKDPGKFIIFMTDGDNNYTSADTSTKAWCDSAKAADVEVFSVAFMAPTRGQALLSYCATDTSHYYDANDAAQLVAAFKEIGEKASMAATRLTN
ncbi:MAG: VWA domain-containing protein [Rhizobium sp.]|nr:VWA domain-containing protein [Rhizobium sp.]